ncbi:MAG: hypothetical protein Q4F99_04940 [bacterium]|nr:hypothetical protein [bacterium]
MFKQTFVAATIASASFAFAAPQAAWIPETADIVIAGANLQNDNTVAKTAWEEAFKAMGIDIDAMRKEFLSCDDAGVVAINNLYKAFEFDVTTDKHAFESITLAATLPPNGESKNFSCIATIETTKALNIDNIATAVNALIDLGDEDKDEPRFVKDGTWYTLNEEDGVIAFSAYKTGLRFVAAEKSTNLIDTLKADTFKGIDATNPLAKALTAPNAYASAQIVIKDLSALVKRYVEMDEQSRQQTMQSAPMIFLTKDLSVSLYSQDKNYIVEIVGSHATEQDATTVAQSITSYRFLMTMMLGSEFAPDSALMKAINAIAISSDKTDAKVKVTLNPDETVAVYKEYTEFVAKQIMMYGAPQGDFDDIQIEYVDEDDGEEELSEEEARAILEEMMKQQ